MHEPLYPSLYQINTRIWLTELGRGLGRPATLDDIPDAELAWVWRQQKHEEDPKPREGQ